LPCATYDHRAIIGPLVKLCLLKFFLNSSAHQAGESEMRHGPRVYPVQPLEGLRPGDGMLLVYPSLIALECAQCATPRM
jgi:hypothetical protein